MALTDYTYVRVGATLAYLENQVPGTGGSVGAETPPSYQLVNWDSTYKDDLDAAMSSLGWTYLWAGTPPVALTIAQIQTVVLTSDGVSIAPADGWVTVATKTIDTRGGSTISVQLTAVTASNGIDQPHLRVLVNCTGIFSDVVVGAAQYDLPTTDEGGRAMNAPVPIADTSPTIKTYTFTLQLQTTSGASTIQAKAGTVMSLVEYRA